MLDVDKNYFEAFCMVFDLHDVIFVFDKFYQSTHKICLFKQTDAQTNGSGRVYLQRRRFSDDSNIENLRKAVSLKNLNMRSSMSNSFTETRPRTMRVTPLYLSPLQEMSPNVAVEDAPRFEVGQSIDLKHQNYQKLKMTKKYLSTVFALCYCLFLIVFSLIVFIGDGVLDLHPVPQVTIFLKF